MECPKNKPVRLKGAALQKLYQRVFERDNYTCQDCGTMKNIDRAPHHKVFKSQGGEDISENLITLCRVCHGKKHGINYII